jgi:acyl transferase domain-containing protein/phosphopantetheinyl transferase
LGTPDDIAIVGMAATFPQAPDVDTFWGNILAKVDAVGEAPPGWLGDDIIYDPNCKRGDLRIYTKTGGFLGDLARFDPRPYGTMPVAVSGAEPDQFLALKAAVDALADAGYDKKPFNRERTGIILGHAIHAHRGNVNGIQHGLVLAQTIGILRSVFPELSEARAGEIEAMLSSKLASVNFDTVPGLVPNMMTGRIANRLDLMGPNYIMDAACASSLLAVKSAIAELRSGRADLMLAGGVNTTSSTFVFMVFCQLGALSRNSRIRPFDSAADGTLLGEGQGIVVLKRLEDALRDGDRIYAVVKGVGASSDGRAMGLMAPRLEGEILAMQRAYADSGIDPATIDLVEAHGTGIPLGDQLEIQALSAIIGERQGPAPRVALGSVKSMIGHCIPAAGVASIIKMAKALEAKILPPTLADEINPALGLDRTPLFLNTEPLPWLHRREAPRRAAINAFGFGGVNSHMILEEAPGAGADPTAAFGLRHRATAELFLLAEDTRERLVEAARSLAERAGEAGLPLRRLAAETFARLGHGGHRLAVVAEDAAALHKKLLGVLDRLGNADTHRLQSRTGVFFTDQPIEGRIAFIFPGENSQYPQMLGDLALASPAVREWLDRLEGLFHGEREVPHRLLLYPPALGLADAERQDLAVRLRGVDNGSEAVFFADIALFALLRGFDVQPDFFLGHSTGENAAIIASGLVTGTPDDVCDYIRRMNAVFRTVDEGNLIPNGMLLTIGAIDRAAIDRVVERHPEIEFTMDNCPNQVVLFGPAPLMNQVNAELSAQGAICTALPMSWAYHTTYVTPMVEGFARIVGPEKIGKPLAPVYSCASAGPFPEDPGGVHQLLRQQYVSRVRFTETIRRLYEDGARIFVEVGPGSTLTGFVGDILRDQPHLALATDSSRRSSLEQILQLFGQLFVHRVPLSLKPLYAEGMSASGGASASPQPVLESAVPFIHLAPHEAARMREILAAAIPAPVEPVAPAAPEPPPVAGPPARPPEIIEALPSSRPAARPARSLSDHFGLMTDFLYNQALVTEHAVGRRRDGGRPPYSGWSGNFALPFAAAVEFVSASPATVPGDFVALVGPWLGRGDLDQFQREIAGYGAQRQIEWVMGRLAARRALAAWLAAQGAPASAHECAILYDTEGRPYPDGGGIGAGSVFLSISHKGGVAAAAAADRPLGIDLEQFTALRDPDGVFRLAFSAPEAALLGNGHGPDARAVTLAWSAKEAAAKSLGQKMLLRERDFMLTAFDPAQGRARLSHGGAVIDAFSAVDGDFVCTLATPQFLQ